MDATDSLLSTLAAITGTGDFHSTGAVPFFLPSLLVEGVGEIAFPLPTAQAKELIAVAEAAPYGMGTKTVRNESIRKCWQIDAAHFSIKSMAWEEFLAATVDQVREDMGIVGKISAHPYKLLVYGEGGHFKAHRDTEKLDAMFGTLIIALPSAHEGGRLIVRHENREIEVDFSQKEHFHDFQHAAFFADCEHEVEPVRSGYRCCLVYNLRLDGGDPASLNLSLDAQARTLLAPLAMLKDGRRGELSAVLLEHSYTEANLSLKNLKGHDVARAKALFGAAKEAGFFAHLALVTFHQMGELENGDDYGRRYHRYDDDDDDGEGGTMDHWYRRAALVLWAVDDHERILCQYDFRGACAALATLAVAKRTAAAFKRLGEAVVACFPEELPPAHHISRASDLSAQPFAITLRALADAGARDLLDTLIASVPTDAFLLCDATLWSKLQKTFGIEAFASIYDALLADDPENNRQTLFQILDGLLACKAGAERAGIIAARLSQLAPKPPRSSYYGSAKSDPEPPGDWHETRILLAASHLLEKTMSSATPKMSAPLSKTSLSSDFSISITSRSAKAARTNSSAPRTTNPISTRLALRESDESMLATLNGL